MQRSDDINKAASNGARRAINFAEIMVQGSARMFEIQAAAAKTFCQYPAKNAAMMGAPDWSELFKKKRQQSFL
ncbi:MAG: hypothetical protein ACREV3_08780 [Gammaproteobacteria bacterium]